mgnify:CR=1 FL=1
MAATPTAWPLYPTSGEDLARRDFTINAMAYSAEEGLCDPFGGQEDLARGVVRAVGDPLRRLKKTLCASCVSTALRPGSVL